MRTMEEVMEPIESLYDGVETVNGFCYLGDTECLWRVWDGSNSKNLDV